MQLTTALLVLVLSTAAIAQFNTEEGNGLLRGISQTSEQVDVESYDSKTDLGITLSSTTQSLLVASSTGEVLIHYNKPFYKNRNGKELDQLIVLNGQPFLDHRRDNKATSYSITQEEADELTQAAGQQPESIFANVIDRIVQNSANKEDFHKEALRTAITALINDPRVPLIISTAIHMGEKEKIIGKEYPPAMPFYNLARLIPTLRSKEPRAEQAVCTTTPVECCRKKFPCFSTCPPCPERKCIGMNSPGCNCFEWVCGNCCFQRGCCIHDYCCRMHGLFTFACLNFLSLTCKNFNCPEL